MELGSVPVFLPLLSPVVLTSVRQDQFHALECFRETGMMRFTLYFTRIFALWYATPKKEPPHRETFLYMAWCTSSISPGPSRSARTGLELSKIDSTFPRQLYNYIINVASSLTAQTKCSANILVWASRSPRFREHCGKTLTGTRSIVLHKLAVKNCSFDATHAAYNDIALRHPPNLLHT